jgi:hypothetical protein
MRSFAKNLPYILFCFFWLDTVIEVYAVRYDVWLMEDQEMEVFSKTRRAIVN